ncbi:hypothetical protein L1887_52871 [Cichorium endivia]|nr:hypothetical protein L1887_52871 [Cichorium endivia]
MPQCDRSRRRGSDEQGPRIVHIELSSQEGEKLEDSAVAVSDRDGLAGSTKGTPPDGGVKSVPTDRQGAALTGIGAAATLDTRIGCRSRADGCGGSPTRQVWSALLDRPQPAPLEIGGALSGISRCHATIIACQEKEGTPRASA